MRAIVQKGIVPDAGAEMAGMDALPRFFYEGEDFAVGDVVAGREEFVEKDRAHVGFEVEGGGVVGEDEDACGCRGADAGQGEQGFARGGDAAGVVFADLACEAREGQGAAVVAQSLPGTEHIGGACGGQGVDGGKLLQPALVVALDAGDLRLLQHDFADENRVGVGGAAPGEVAIEFAAAREYVIDEGVDAEVNGGVKGGVTGGVNHAIAKAW